MIRPSARRCVFVAGVIGSAWSVSAQSVTYQRSTQDRGFVATHLPLSATEADDMSGGAAAGDFNGDGWQDLFFVTGGGGPDLLFINDGDGTFTEAGAAWGVDAIHLGMGAATADYDRDGDLDLYVTSLGAVGARAPGAHRLYRNDGGVFTDVALSAGVEHTSLVIADGFSPAWGDYDLDGHLDLAVAGWFHESGGNRLFRNNGDGTFSDETLALGDPMLDVRGFTPRFCDMNGDQYPELLWVADVGTSRYFRNLQNGTFEERTAAARVGLDGNGMGQTVGDLDGDGLPEWYVTSIFPFVPGFVAVPGTGNMLYLNRGGHTFDEVATEAGVRDGRWGWGTVSVDTNHDGTLDLVETNGWAGQNGIWARDPSFLYASNGDGTFSNIAFGASLDYTGNGRGLVNADFDNDGDQDLVIVTNRGSAVLFQCHVLARGPDSNHWLRVLLDARGHASASAHGIGARVRLVAQGRAQHRWIDGGSNYLSQSELSAHFGLASATEAYELEVAWPGAGTLRFDSVPADRTIVVRACPAEWTGDDVIDVADVLAYVSDWLEQRPGADLDLDARIGAPDLLRFLDSWFVGSAGGCS